MDPLELEGKRLALLVCREKEDGEDEWALFPGVARVRDGALWLERGLDQPDVPIQPEWLERIRPTVDAIREDLAGADYFLTLSCGVKPDGDDDGFVASGLKWPD